MIGVPIGRIGVFKEGVSVAVAVAVLIADPETLSGSLQILTRSGLDDVGVFTIAVLEILPAVVDHTDLTVTAAVHPAISGEGSLSSTKGGGRRLVSTGTGDESSQSKESKDSKFHFVCFVSDSFSKDCIFNFMRLSKRQKESNF